MSKTPPTLIIMDGFGLRDDTTGNAIANAKKPNLDRIFAEDPGCKLSASGRSPSGENNRLMNQADAAVNPAAARQGASWSWGERDWST